MGAVARAPGARYGAAVDSPVADLVRDPRYDNPTALPALPRYPLGITAYINKTLAVAGTSEQLWVADPACMEAGYAIDITTDKDCFVAFNAVGGDPDASDSFEFHAGESYNPAVTVLIFSIRFVNKNPGETPHIRGVVWGA